MQINSAVPNALNTSLQGMQRSSQQVTTASETIARGSVGNGAHNVEALVALVEGEQAYGANVKAFATSSRMLGVLLDTEA
ncbi:hypothetical protein [Aliidiomarina quisquiliarum]|uniref:hypothetical protein n=1 Tax=Aliidiomarina quisquiliarum TaxID=2938947 RepID=UPI00208FA418|nr:hypothetical protein [Aliidiomarina quisquiliarum]MCO4322384.1 hypothetical protein [Aliidiomarina quisquiliarum]